MGVAAGIFSFAIMHYLRIYGPRASVSPGLHQVEIVVDARALTKAFLGTSSEPSLLATRTRVSFPSYRTLSSSGIPTRQTANFRVRALVGPAGDDGTLGDGARLLRPRNGRFVNGDFFALFSRRFRWGGPWSGQQEAAGARQAVLSRALNEEMFAGRDSTGQAVMVDGLPFTVAGVLAEHQPFIPEWDWAAAGGGQDAVYLPFPAHEWLRTWPETPTYLSPVGPAYADLLASDTLFVSYWMELPTVGSRAAYSRFLEQRLGRRGIAYNLRDLAALRAAFPFPRSAITFFTFLTFVVLMGGGAVMTRLLLAKGLTRGDESGIFRALGAPRRALFSRQLLEAAMLSLVACAVAVAFAMIQAHFYNSAVGDTDIPLVMTARALLITFLATLSVGVLSSLYPAWRLAARRPTVALGRR